MQPLRTASRGLRGPQGWLCLALTLGMLAGDLSTAAGSVGVPPSPTDAAAAEPVVLGAGLTAAQAADRVAAIVRDTRRPDVQVDLHNWPNIVTVRYAGAFPAEVSARLDAELGIWLTLYKPEGAPLINPDGARH